jgi:hypothetical protein
MKAEQVIKMWKLGFSKKKIIDEYAEDYSRSVLSKTSYTRKPSAQQLRIEAQREVEKILHAWWMSETED